MIKPDDIEVFIGKDRIRCTLRVSAEKHYGMTGIPERDQPKYIWMIINDLKQQIMRELNGSPTGYKSTPYEGP
jgi:hypothetical protein